MVWICFPLGRLAATCDDYTRAVLGTTGLGRHRRRKVHRKGNRANDTIGVIHQANELTNIGFAAQVQYVIQTRMVMAHLTDLYKLHARRKALDDLLPAIPRPNLGGKIAFPACNDDPVRTCQTILFYLRNPVFLLIRQMNIATKQSWFYLNTKNVLKVLREAVNKMPWAFVALVNEWVMAINDTNFRVTAIQARYIGVMIP